VEDRAGADEPDKKEGAVEEMSGKQRASETSCSGLTLPALPIASAKGLSVSHCNKGSGDQEGGRRGGWSEA